MTTASAATSTYPSTPTTSLLTRKFGPELTNYFSASPLNRLSFLRSNDEFLRAALPSARFLLMADLRPLSSARTALAWVGYPVVADLLGQPFEDGAAAVVGFDSRVQVATLVFLGIDEGEVGEGGFRFVAEAGVEYCGRPVFAVDVTETGGGLAEKCRVVRQGVLRGGDQFRDLRLELDLVPSDAAIVAQARSLLDWNNRNQFCSTCGSRTLSTQAGTKRICPPTDLAFQPPTRPPCISRTGVHNNAFPRTDPTVIMAILNSTGDKLLLGRQRRWPKNHYSTLAGFCEPAESIESAVRRETWEESNVRVGRVVLHSSQPWPHPANLMVGAVGEAVAGGEEIHLGHDPELEDARWVSVERVRNVLEGRSGGGGDGDHDGEGVLKLPPATAIAHQLLLAVVNGFHLEKL